MTNEDNDTENDQLFPEEILEQGRKHLEAQHIEHEIKTYSGVPHGQSGSIEHIIDPRCFPCFPEVAD
jgi:hypothetical protein